MKDTADHPSTAGKIIFTLWKGWETLFKKIVGAKPVSSGDSFFYTRRIRYKGEPLDLGDGRKLQHGEKVLELHLNNDMLIDGLKKGKSSVHTAITLIKIAKRGLPELAAYLDRHPERDEIKAVYGVSIINRGVEGLGFTVREIPNRLFYKASTFYLRLLLSVMHPKGAKRLKERSVLLVPKIIVMSSNELMEKYL